jgi:hypothetical protein
MGLRDHRLYRVWWSMKQRTVNPNSHKYAEYGARGIKVCDRWQEPNGQGFRNFLEDMESSYKEGLSLERTDVNGDYSPENCTWATATQQVRNRRNTVQVEFRGVTRPLPEWCELLGLNYTTTYHRLNRGWSVERALTEGVDPAALKALN